MRATTFLFLTSGLLSSIAFGLRDGFVVRPRGGDELEPNMLAVSPYCFPPCELDICGYVPLSNICPTRDSLPIRLHTGSESGSSVGSDSDISDGSASLYTSEPYSPALYSTSRLGVRAPGTWNKPWHEWWTTGDWSAEDVAHYIPRQIGTWPVAEGEAPPPIPEPKYVNYAQGLAHVDEEGRGDERAVSGFAEFSQPLIQIGSAGLHGCTVVWVISKRAVWGAHFWEVYSQGRSQTEDPRYQAQFTQRVLDFIEGKEVTKPVAVAPSTAEIKVVEDWNKAHEDETPRKTGPKLYLDPEGPSLQDKRSFFNEPDDETMVFIFAPLRFDKSEEFVADSTRGYHMGSLRYPTRVQKIAESVSNVVPVQKGDRRGNYLVVVNGYNALDHNKEAELEEANTSQRGITMFQRDANARGDGKPSWRLFLQQYVRTGDN